MSKKKRHIFGILSLLMVMLLAGCQGAANSQAEQKPVFIDEPGSPYPMVADRWELDHWLTQRGQSGVYHKDGSLSWPEAPRYADAPYRVEGLGNAIRLRQYLWGGSHVDGMGDLVTELTWKNGQIMVLKQYMDWCG